MFLIGMISYTSMASTPLMEEKQKTTIEAVTDLIAVENVVATDIFCTALKVRKSKNNDLIKPEQPLEIITDVGWQRLNLNILKAKLIVQNSNQITRIRNDS